MGALTRSSWPEPSACCPQQHHRAHRWSQGLAGCLGGWLLCLGGPQHGPSHSCLQRPADYMQCMCVHVGAHFLLHTYVYILMLAQVTSTAECFQRLCWSCLWAVTSIPRARGQGAWRRQQTELLQKLLLPLAGCAPMVAAPKGQPSLGAWNLLSCLTQ